MGYITEPWFRGAGTASLGFRPKAHGQAVLAVCIGAILLSALWLLLTGNTGIRYSADHADTVPMWTRWVPALAGVLLVRLIPPSLNIPNPLAGLDRGKLLAQARTLVALAVAFSVLLYVAVAATGVAEPWHILLKLVLLLAAPVILLRLLRPTQDLSRDTPGVSSGPDRRWRWVGPVLPVAAWFGLSYLSPLAVPYGRAPTADAATLIATVIVVFLVNAVLEEYFYRVWLQTRLELFLGRWPAVLASSILWASWHAAIQGQGRLDLDLASVVVNLGVVGLFLGYLWARYRTVWALLIVHGAMNSAPLFLAML